MWTNSNHDTLSHNEREETDVDVFYYESNDHRKMGGEFRNFFLTIDVMT